MFEVIKDYFGRIVNKMNEKKHDLMVQFDQLENQYDQSMEEYKDEFGDPEDAHLSDIWGKGDTDE